MIIVDVHEPEKVKALADEVRELPIDVIIEGSERKYAVERKTILDFWNSVKDGRLWKQMKYLEDMRNEGYVSFLVIIGSWSKVFKFAKTMTPIKMIGMQVALSSFGVSVVQLPNHEWFLIFLNYLKNKSGQKRSYSRVNIPKPITRTLWEEQVDVLRAIDGIGEKTAEKLLQKFGSVKSVVNASREELFEVLKSKTEHFLEVVCGV